MLPKTGKPEATRENVLAWANTLSKSYAFPILVGRRGYFRDIMGVVGKNDINVYDDAIFLVTPTQSIPFNANVDPSRADPNIAQLLAGCWWYKLGTHNLSKAKEFQYEALVQAAEVDVFRFGTTKVQKGIRDNRGLCLGDGKWRGYFGVNMHRGGNSTTGSLACQTIHPTQWEHFIDAVKETMTAFDVKRIQYILTAREDEPKS